MKDIDAYYQKLNTLMPDDRQKNDMIMTLAGAGLKVCEFFLNKNFKKLGLTDYQIYCMQMIIANTLTLTGDLDASNICRIDLKRHNLSEQDQQTVFLIIKEIHKRTATYIKERESV